MLPNMSISGTVEKMRSQVTSAKLLRRKLLTGTKRKKISMKNAHVGDHRSNFKIKYSNMSSNPINIAIIAHTVLLPINCLNNTIPHKHPKHRSRQSKIFHIQYLNKTKVPQQFHPFPVRFRS